MDKSSSAEEIDPEEIVEAGNPGFLERLVGSCYNPRTMILPLVENPWKTIWFLVRVLLLVAVLQVGVTGYYTWTVVGDINQNLERNLPPLHFQNGKLSVEAETPYRFKIYEDYEFILDPRGEVTRARLGPEVMGVAVDGALFIRTGREGFQYLSTRLYEGSKSPSEVLVDSDFLARWLPYLRGVLIFTFTLVALLELFLGTAIRVGLVSFGGLIARPGDSSEPGLGWGQVLLVSCYSIVPVVLLQTLFRIITVAGYRFPVQEFVLLLAGTAWTFIVVSKLQSGLEKTAVDPD